MTVRVHPLDPMAPEQLEAVVTIDAHAFLTPRPEGELREAYDRMLGIARILLAQDDDASRSGEGTDGVVGVAAAYPLRIAVPGGEVDVAGVTWVSVLPTARRRGVLRSLMTALLADRRDAGLAVAALWASEPTIYGRFGYGLATQFLSARLPRTDVLVDAPEDPRLVVRYAVADPAVMVDVATRAAGPAPRPGTPRYDETWASYRLQDTPDRRRGASELHCVVVLDPALAGAEAVRGYALFSDKEDEEHGRPAGVVRLRDLVAVDPSARAALWRFVLDRDLTVGVDVSFLPVDDPIWRWVPNPRAAQPRLLDGVYVRLVDLPSALATRTASAPLDVVVNVRDETCPWNAGTWQISAREAAATFECRRVEQAPELAMDVRVLGGAYLGGPTVASALAAGQVTEHRPGAARALSQALAGEQPPNFPFVF